jgi:hypothetical protein
MKQAMWFLGLAVYLFLAAGTVMGGLAVMDNECMGCRLHSAGVSTTTASRETRRIMRYYGVSALKMVNDRAYVLIAGKWRRVDPARPLASKG